MGKLRSNFYRISTSKLTPLIATLVLTAESVACSDVFSGAKTVLSKISVGLVGLMSGIAFVCLIWQVFMMFANAGDDKKAEVHKNAIKKILLYYAIGVSASYLLRIVSDTLSSTLGDNSGILKPTNIDNTGGLK